MKPRVWKATRAKFRRRRIDSWFVREKWPGEHGGEKILKDDITFFKRKVEFRPYQMVENAEKNCVTFVRASGRPVREEVNNALLMELKQRQNHTFVVDSSLACMFNSLGMNEPPVTPHRKTFVELVQSVRLGAPPILQKEYAEFQLASPIPVGPLTPEDIQVSQHMAKNMIYLFKRSPKALWMALKKQHKRRLHDYMLVVQSAMLYPKTTILTDDRDFYIFDSMIDEIEGVIFRQHRDRFVDLRTVSFVNVTDDLGLDVNLGSGAWPLLRKCKAESSKIQTAV